MDYDWHAFSKRFRDLCDQYCDMDHEYPPCYELSESRMNSLLAGTRKPTPEELLIISKGFDVSINYLMTGDELFPSLHGLKKNDVRRLLEEIEEMKPDE